MTWMTNDQLERKLQLLLGSQEDWMAIYTKWCIENNVESIEVYDDHQINLFVRQMKARDTAKRPAPTLLRRRG